MRGFGLPTNNVIQTAINESTDPQVAQASDEQSLLLPAIQQRSFGHDFSRIAVRRPQAKLTVGEPGDKYEHSADWMGNQVMRMVVPDQLNADSVQPVQDSLQRKCTACEQEEDKVQTKSSIQMATDGGLQVGDNIESRLNSSKGVGSLLVDDVRSFMEPRFGVDFSQVRVHTGSDAVQMNQDLGAQAFTHGSDVDFGAEKSPGNNELTAHELTHVVQQTGGIQAKSNTQTEILQRDCDPTLASCSPDQTTTPATPDQTATPATPDQTTTATATPDQTTTPATPGQTETPAPGPTSDDYKQGYQDGLNGGESQAGPRDGDALTDYNEGYAKGHYEFSQGSAPAPATSDQTPTPAPASGVPPIGGSIPDYSQMTWQQLLPRAHGAKITNIDLHTPGNKIDKWGIGEAPTLNYAPDKNIHIDPASAAPQGGVGGTTAADVLAAENSALSAAQDAAISQIITARTKIPDRPMGRSRNNNAGYDYNPDNDPAAKEYNQWIKSALPTGVDASDWNWQVFKQIQKLEGQEGRFTAFDKTLSVGPGFSTSGLQTQQVIGKTFNLLPDVKSVAFAAGLTVDANGGMTVVDTDKKWILDSQNAAAYLQTDVSLLSLLVNISQGVQPIDASDGAVAPEEQGKQRQALLDAEWQQFLSGTLANVTSLVQSWSLDSAVLAVHAKHAQPANFPFTFWNAQNSPDLHRMVAAIYNKVGKSAKYICTGKYAQYYGSSNGSGD